MKLRLFKNLRNVTLGVAMSLFGLSAFGQTVYDVISGSSDHSTLKTAIDAAGLAGTLSDPTGEFTVFAPDNTAFTNLLTALGVSAPDLLASGDLANILKYHVLSGTTNAADITNGAIVTPLNTANTLKLTVKTNGDVFVNQAQVNAADLSASNGVVHSIDAALLTNETVADVAIDNGFSTLVTAVVEARLLPALSDPFAKLTVFAPTDAAFADVLANLGITAGDLLASADLTDILLYHVIGSEVASSDITNGQIVTALNANNTIKMTVKANGDVFANHAQVTTANVAAENGVVHIIDQVILDKETVVDAAIDNNFTVLTQAVVAAELLPALTNPFEKHTVFAPTDAAFTTFITDAGITAADLLADAGLSNILLYHTVGAEVLSGDLTNGAVTTLNGEDVTIDLSNGVMVNDASVVTADVQTENGVVHAIDKVLTPGTASIEEISIEKLTRKIHRKIG
ncbi:MAG TPA: fasciclin domain-containing protein [Brumimicrobium sp.]|nr:fasciclin domain-containing protein [Brumimicrobium sp.]